MSGQQGSVRHVPLDLLGRRSAIDSSSTTMVHSPPNKSRLAVALVAVAFVVLYLAGTSENYIYADDALTFVADVFHEPRIVVHHLVLVVLHYANAALGFTAPGDFSKTLWLFKTYVALTSGLALWIVGALAHRWSSSLKVAIASMMFVGFTYGYWSYSIVPDVYVPAIAFALAAVFFAERACHEPRAARAFGLLSVAAVSVLLSSLNHQSHSLIVAPITLVLLFWARRDTPWKWRIQRAAFFFALTGLLGFVVFFASYLLSRSEGGFVQYIRGYSAWMKMMPYDKVQLLTPVYAVAGILRTLAFPEYSLHFDSVYEKVHAHFSLKLLMDERYLVRNFPDPIVALLLAIILVLVVSVAVLVALAVRNAWRKPPGSAGFWMVALWLPVQTLFFGWWEPTSNEFWIWLMPCLGLLGGGLVMSAATASRWRATPWVFLAALFVVNVPVVSRYWNANDCIYRVNKTYLAHVKSDDLVVSLYFTPINCLIYLHPNRPPIYERKAHQFSFDDPALSSELDKVRTVGGRVFLDPILTMPDETENALIYYQGKARREQVDAELLKLEAYCRQADIPLYGVTRKGSEIIPFQRRPFGGYLQWIEG